jgi:hypothetical protein
MSVRLSARNNSVPIGRIFTKFDICVFFETVQKIQVSLKSDKNSGFFTWRPTYDFYHIWLTVSWNEKSFGTKVAEKIKTHFVFNNIFFQKSYRLWDNVAQYCRAGQATDDNTIRRMPIARWIIKATNTHSEYVILIAFPLQQWLHEGASILRYTYIAGLVAFRKTIRRKYY